MAMLAKYKNRPFHQHRQWQAILANWLRVIVLFSDLLNVEESIKAISEMKMNRGRAWMRYQNLAEVSGLGADLGIRAKPAIQSFKDVL